MKMISLFLVLLFVMACSALPLSELPIDDDTKVSAAVAVGCAAAEKAGCFEDSEIQGVLGVVVTVTQCTDAVKRIIAEKQVTINMDALTKGGLTCKKFLKGVGL